MLYKGIYPLELKRCYAKQRKPNTRKVLNHSFISRNHCPIKDFKISSFIQSSSKTLINKEQSLNSCQYRLVTQEFWNATHKFASIWSRLQNLTQQNTFELRNAEITLAITSTKGKKKRKKKKRERVIITQVPANIGSFWSIRSKGKPRQWFRYIYLQVLQKLVKEEIPLLLCG